MNMDFKQLASVQPKLLHKAVQDLAHRYKQAPDDEIVGLKLGLYLRQAGQLEEAMDLYRQLANRLTGCTEARYLLRILANGGYCKPESESLDFQPVPFLRFPGFITSTQQNLLWQHVSRFREKFLATTVNDNDYRPASRQSQAIYLQDLKPIAKWFLPKVSDLIGEYYARLGLAEVPLGKTELQLTQHGDDSFFLAHRDTTGSGKYRLRRTTFVYYFYQEPRAFSGGDLLLFDETNDQNEQRQRYVRYSPANNELLLFPSQAYHQVTPVHSGSKDFLSGRFTLNGWFSAAG